jgi:hypothetical protein
LNFFNFFFAARTFFATAHAVTIVVKISFKVKFGVVGFVGLRGGVVGLHDGLLRGCRDCV